MEVNTWYIIVQSFITWSYGEWARVQNRMYISLILLISLFKFWSFFFCWYKLLITKSVKNNSFLPSLNWTFSGIYGDQCCSLIEILSPLCLAHSSFWVRLTFLFWPHPNSHNISEVSNRGFWIWSFREETPCYALTIN